MLGLYGIQLFDDIHTYLPDILYNPSRFNNVHDLLDYIINSANQVSPYNRGLNEYRRFVNNIQQHTQSHTQYTPPQTQSTVQSHPSTTNDTPLPPQTPPRIRTTIPISIFSTYDTVPITSDGLFGDTGDTLSNIFTQLLNPSGMRNFLDQSVIVRPTEQQITRGTSLEIVSALVEDNCAICQDAMERGVQIRKINHCGHIFHKECIDAWFQRNVRCPTCRHDIRENNQSSRSSTTSTSSSNNSRQRTNTTQSGGVGLSRTNTYERTDRT
jgi:hypothetical protein